MPHFGIPHTDDDPNAPSPRRPSNAVRRRGGGNLTSSLPAPGARFRNAATQPQLPVNPQASVLSQQPRRSRNIARAAGNPNNPITQAFEPIDRFFGNTQEQRASGDPGPLSEAISAAPGAVRDFAAEAPAAAGEFLSRRPSLGGTGRDIVHGQGRRPGDFRAGNQNNSMQRPFEAIDRFAGRFGEAASEIAGQLGEGITTPSQFARDVGSGFRRIGRDVAQATSGLTGLFTADTGQDLADSFRGPNNPRPGTADDGLTPQQRLDLTFRGQGEPADITSEIGDLPVRERANRLEEHGLDVERLGQDPTTVIRGTNVSQTRGGQGQDGNFPEAVFDEGFEVPVGTTDAELRDPERLKVLQARNSLSQSLRQVPAPGQTAIPAAVQSKMLADFDAQASAERGATTRGRERNASLERRTAFTNAITSRLGLGGSRTGGRNQFDVIGIPFGEGLSGNLGEEAFLIDKTGATAPQRIPINRSRRERDTQANRKQLEVDLRDVNPGITDAEISAIFREWVDTGEFPPGTDFNSVNSGGFGGFF